MTTEEPASFGPDIGRVLITSKTDANAASMPHRSAGGVAYVGVWGRSDYASEYSPALVYYDNLAIIAGKLDLIGDDHGDGLNDRNASRGRQQRTDPRQQPRD